MTLLIEEFVTLEEINELMIEDAYIVRLGIKGRGYRMTSNHSTFTIVFYNENGKSFQVLLTEHIHWEIIASAEKQKRISNVVYLSLDLIRGVLRNG